VFFTTIVNIIHLQNNLHNILFTSGNYAIESVFGVYQVLYGS